MIGPGPRLDNSPDIPPLFASVMDTWLIAQCMARLPPLTYFSHPESSLQDFFSSERNSSRDERSRRRDAHSGQSGTAEHELRFLSSLRLSLGAAPHTPSVDVVVDHDHPLSQPAVDSSVFRASDRNAMAVERYDITRQFTRSDHYSFVIPPRSRNVLGAPAVPAASTPAPLARLHIAETPAAHSVLLHADSQQQRPETSSFTYGTHISNATRLHSTSGYQCCWEGDNYQQCGVWVEGGIKEVWKHVQKAHGLRGLYSGSCHCKWGGCEEKLKVSSLQRHLAKHLAIKWRCSTCDIVLARHDCVRKHIKFSESCHGATVTRHSNRPNLAMFNLPGHCQGARSQVVDDLAA